MSEVEPHTVTVRLDHQNATLHSLSYYQLEVFSRHRDPRRQITYIYTI